MSILTLEQASQVIANAKAEGNVTVTTNGCFDMLSFPHVQYLQNAKAQGDYLIVGINSDASVTQLKGDKRPIVPERDRAALVASLECVDAVFLFDDLDPRSWLPILKPDVHVNAAEYTEDCVEAQVVQEIGARLYLAPRSTDSPSTSDYIQIILDRYT